MKLWLGNTQTETKGNLQMTNFTNFTNLTNADLDVLKSLILPHLNTNSKKEQLKAKELYAKLNAIQASVQI